MMNLRRHLLCSFVVIVTETFIYNLSFSLRDHGIAFDVPFKAGYGIFKVALILRMNTIWWLILRVIKLSIFFLLYF